MRRASCLLSATAVLLISHGVAGQSRPDFSGRWTTQADPAAVSQRGGGQDSAGQGARGGRGGGQRGGPAGDMGSGWGPVITITQDATRLTVEYMFFARGDMQPPLRFVYALDGSATKNSVKMGRGTQEQTSNTVWEGDRLVVTTLHAFTDPASGQPLTGEVKRTLVLASSDTLVVETMRGGVLGGPPSTTRTVYRRM